jgi:PKD repeat protein
MPHKRRKNMAYVVLPEYLAVIQSVAYTKGVPASWLAAVCELAGWNPSLKDMNYDRVPNSVRRFGIAGIWASINELVLQKDPGQIDCSLWSEMPAGWLPAVYWAGNQLWQGSSLCTCPGTSLKYDVTGNLNVAAAILKNCGDTVKRICGSYNELIFLRWQLGCNYVPQKNAEGNCIIPPGLPNIFKAEMQELVEAQGIFAEQFAEEPIIPPPVVVSLSANALEAPPGSPITFNANIAGGVPPYLFTWDFNDPFPSQGTNPTIAHAFETEGTYQCRVTATDSRGNVAVSAPLVITITEEAPPPPSGTNKAVLWGLLGLAGLVGIAALGKKGNKREQARKLRQQASALRQQAAQLRSSGKHQQAQAVEQRATELENKASQLEAEATREEQEKARREAEKYRMK